MTINVNFNPNPHPFGWGAAFEWMEDGHGTMTGGTITCYGTACTAHLLAHEIGHALGLGDVTDYTTCANALMRHENPGSDFGDACSRADTFWTGPSTSDPTGTGGGTSGGGGSGGGGPLNRDCASGYECSPLLLDLDGGGIETTSTLDPVLFDLDGSGSPKFVAWTSPTTEEGFLWIDRNDDHVVNDGHELFGIATELPSGELARNGFVALRAYDAVDAGGNGDGEITVADRIWGRLRIWVDANHDGVSQPQEVGPIQQFGVMALHLGFTTDEQPDAAGNFHRLRGSYTRRVVHAGRPTLKERALDDVYFRVRE